MDLITTIKVTCFVICVCFIFLDINILAFARSFSKILGVKKVRKKKKKNEAVILVENGEEQEKENVE